MTPHDTDPQQQLCLQGSSSPYGRKHTHCVFRACPLVHPVYYTQGIILFFKLHEVYYAVCDFHLSRVRGQGLTKIHESVGRIQLGWVGLHVFSLKGQQHKYLNS